MVKAFKDVMKIAEKQECEMRTSASMLGIGRVGEAMTTRGLWQ